MMNSEVLMRVTTTVILTVFQPLAHLRSRDSSQIGFWGHSGRKNAIFNDY